jgi:cerevisin
MASPHVAGLAAYFLSLYPDSFDAVSQEFDDAAYEQVLGLGSSYRQAAQIVMGKFQQWTGVSASPLRAKSGKPLSPKALKKALEKVGTKGVLTVSWLSPAPPFSCR